MIGGANCHKELHAPHTAKKKILIFKNQKNAIDLFYTSPLSLL